LSPGIKSKAQKRGTILGNLAALKSEKPSPDILSTNGELRANPRHLFVGHEVIAVSRRDAFLNFIERPVAML
jgi:hypothetical protein